MLSRHQRNNMSQLSLRGGMRNVAFIAGTAHSLDASGGFILQSNNLNERIRFDLDSSTSMPSWVQEGRPLKIICRVIPKKVPRIYYNEDSHSEKSEESPPLKDLVLVQSLKVLYFEKPSVFDMDPSKVWRKTLRAGVPEAPDPATKLEEATAESPEGDSSHKNEIRSFSHSVGRVYDNGNDVKIAGFVQQAIIERKTGKDNDGKSNCLILLIRQTEDPNDIVYVRCFTAKVDAVKSKIKPGTPLLISGKIRVQLKNTGRLNAEGHHVVSVVQYVHAVVNGLGIPDADDIAFEPTWAKELSSQGKAKRTPEPLAAVEPEATKSNETALDADVEV